MTIEELEAMWAEDSVIPPTDCDYETHKTSKLHSKYYAQYRTIARQYDKKKTQRAKLLKLKTEYYLGELDKETLDKYQWKPFQKRLMKTELPVYLAADDDLIQVDLNIAELRFAVEFLESIIKSIGNRNYHIRNIVDYLKFKNG